MIPDERGFHVWDCERMLKFRCAWNWESLAETGDADVRHCPECDKDVYRCRTPADFVAHGEQGRCVAVPDDLTQTLSLGEPEPAEVLRKNEAADRGQAWWAEVVDRQSSLGPEAMDRIRRERENLAMDQCSGEHLAILKQAARLGGVFCPKCGHNMAWDSMGIMLYLNFRCCERCREPFEPDLSDREPR